MARRTRRGKHHELEDILPGEDHAHHGEETRTSGPWDSSHRDRGEVSDDDNHHGVGCSHEEDRDDDSSHQAGDHSHLDGVQESANDRGRSMEPPPAPVLWFSRSLRAQKGTYISDAVDGVAFEFLVIKLLHRGLEVCRSFKLYES